MKNINKIILIVFITISIVSFLAFGYGCKNKILNNPFLSNEIELYPLDENISNDVYRNAVEFANTTTWIYDPTYYKINYPNGDVPTGGACTDVIIRVLRKKGMDLQKLIHDDMAEHFSEYPHKWGLNQPDANIDHRRVLNIMKYLERQGYNVTVTNIPEDYLPGDIVTWELSKGVTHIGIVLKNQDIFHNMGPSSRVESSFLFSYPIIGHYRI